MNFPLDPRVRCNFIARQLVLWASNLGNFNPHRAEQVEFYKKFWEHYGHQKLFPVGRENLRNVAVFLLDNVCPVNNIQFFHMTGLYYALESLPENEQLFVFSVLKENYGQHGRLPV